jgi:hypothetical protein
MRCKFFNAIGLYRMWRWRIRHAEEEELFLISHTSASFSSETTLMDMKSVGGCGHW